jgi:hypothetical protein
MNNAGRATSSRRSASRIHPGMRHGAAVLLPAAAVVELQEAHAINIALTSDFGLKTKTRDEHRGRLRKMADWCMREYEVRTAPMIHALTDKEQQDCRKHFHKCTHDFNCKLIQPEYILAYLTMVKVSEDGVTCLYSHIRKPHDAMLFGAMEQGEVLSRKYHVEIEKFLISFRKKHVVAKRPNTTD